MTTHFDNSPAKLVVFTGNAHRPSRSRALGAYLAQRIADYAPVKIAQFDIVDAGPGLGAAFSREELTPKALKVVKAVEEADALIAITPVYKGSFSGLFKHLFDFLDPMALADKPVLIGATGGGTRHALMVEHQMRPLFGFFSALTVPTAVYATEAEMEEGALTDPALRARADQAAMQMAVLLQNRKAMEGAQARIEPTNRYF